MVRLRWGVVVSVDSSRPGAVELTVDCDEKRAPALAYPDLTGQVAPGDRVLLNTTALELGLGTGGFHLVVTVDGGSGPEAGPRGRTMKARYTPLQAAVEALEVTDRGTLERAESLAGCPVVVAPLHSMIAPAAAGAKAAGAERVAYVMTDGAALPGPFSRLVPALREAGLVNDFITSGQAFGGDHEAITVWSAMLAARAVFGADVVIVADGPGNLGSDTKWGVTALATGHSLNAASMLGGRPVAALRVSFSDTRPRHRGVSHHSLTILSEVCLVPATVAVPQLDGAEREAVWRSLREADLEDRHHLVEVEGGPALELLEERGVAVESMGRKPGDDPAFFLAAGAAGVLAGRMAAGLRRWEEERRA